MPRVALILVLLGLSACGGDPAPRATQQPSPTEEAPSPASTSPGPISPTCSDQTITGEPQFTVEAHDNEFDPDCLVVLGGQALELVNAGSNPHTFTVEGTALDVQVEPGGEPTRTEAVGTVVTPGTYAFFCRFHRAQGMEGELTVTDVG